jgi:hypothetical protein
MTLLRAYVLDTRLEVFMAVKTQVKVFWVATPCSVVVGYQQPTLKMEAVRSSNTTLHGTMTQKTSISVCS